MEWQFLLIVLFAIATISHESESLGEISVNTTKSDNIKKINNTFCEDHGELQCPQPQRGTHCQCDISKLNENKVLCCHVDFRRIISAITDCTIDKKVPDNIREFYIKNCTSYNDTLIFSALHYIGQKLPNLKTLSIVEGGYVDLKNDIKNTTELSSNNVFSKLQCLNLSNNYFQDDSDTKLLIDLLPSLRTVDLSHNNLSRIPDVHDRTKKLWIQINENPQLKCDGIIEAISHKNVSFLRSRNTTCRIGAHFDWFNSVDNIPLHHLELSVKVNRECPSNCTCSVTRLVYVQKNVYFAAFVNCSHSNLKSLPAKIPEMTVVLDVSFNQITNLKVINDKNYGNIKKLDAQHNEISSINELEGSKFIASFEELNLQHNKLERLPAFILTHAFDKNWNSNQAFFGYNEYICDCASVRMLKDLLLKYKKNIPDYYALSCKEMPDKIVIEVKDEEVCIAPVEFATYIYVLIAAEVALLLLLVGKVSYDYWVFKKSGYLPWPASKMPKLPCDCVLET